MQRARAAKDQNHLICQDIAVLFQRLLGKLSWYQAHMESLLSMIKQAEVFSCDPGVCCVLPLKQFCCCCFLFS